MHPVHERLVGEIEQLRARIYEVIAPGHVNRFSWLDAELWIDRQRWLVLALTTATRIGCADADTVPAELYEEIEMKGCRHSSTLPSRIPDVVSAWLAGTGDDRSNGPLVAEFLNHAVVQPLVNPAYASLFWLELGWELHPSNEMSTTLGSSVGPMAIDLATYPASKSHAAEVRAVQITWVRNRFPLEGDWESATDEAWAKRCAEILRDHEPRLLYQAIQARANRLRDRSPQAM